MITYVCTECGEACQSDDGYSDCCNEPTITSHASSPSASYLASLAAEYRGDDLDDNGYDRSGVSDGRGHTYSDADFEAPGF